jgi:hypothetical protein
LPESLPLETLLVEDAPKIRNKAISKNKGGAAGKR